MDVHETTGEIMNDVDWKEGGESGCLMTVVKTMTFAVTLAAVTFAAYRYGTPMLVNLWW